MTINRPRHILGSNKRSITFEMEGVLWENAGSEEKSMSIWMKETVPGKKKRPGQDKNIQDLKEENIQRPQVKLNTQPAKRTSSSAGNNGFRFEEWPDDQGSSGKRVVSQTPTPPLPSTREPYPGGLPLRAVPVRGEERV